MDKYNFFRLGILIFSISFSMFSLAQDRPGPALVGELCTKCHNLDEVVRLRQTRDEWANTVYSMISRGAPIFPDEIDTIINYLSEAYPEEN